MFRCSISIGEVSMFTSWTKPLLQGKNLLTDFIFFSRPYGSESDDHVFLNFFRNPWVWQAIPRGCIKRCAPCPRPSICRSHGAVPPIFSK